jgi:hypothetical protein
MIGRRLGSLAGFARQRMIKGASLSSVFAFSALRAEKAKTKVGKAQLCRRRKTLTA